MLEPSTAHRNNLPRPNTATVDCHIGLPLPARAGLVSVVIPSYNHARFLPDAIQSAMKQTYGQVEIIVIDDGSTDETEQVVKRFRTVRYVKQKNKGVTAARNVGLQLSSGSYVVFLDADDRLLAEALDIGIRSLMANPDCALTFGTFYMIDSEGRKRGVCHPLPRRKYGYRDFLEQNFIGNPGVALYRKDALAAVEGFDSTNQAAGDYDLYLRITYAFPVACHTEPVLEYRRHGSNMSNDPAIMLPACLHALKKQLPVVRGDASLEAALKRGTTHWKNYYGERLVIKLYEDVARRKWKNTARGISQLLIHYPERLTRKVLGSNRINGHKLP
ncbi:MAG TPA: glycosyltransferase [Nitrospiraceae bacterium]|nr:glycosyltransferase [Nitrospiraceae bacterium]